MKDIMVTAITLGLLGAAARMLLPLSKKFVTKLIIWLVTMAEKKISGLKMGEKKKQFVISKLKWFGIKMNDFIDDTIEIAVENMNAQKISTESELKDRISDKIMAGIDQTSVSITNKLTK